MTAQLIVTRITPYPVSNTTNTTNVTTEEAQDAADGIIVIIRKETKEEEKKVRQNQYALDVLTFLIAFVTLTYGLCSKCMDRCCKIGDRKPRKSRVSVDPIEELEEFETKNEKFDKTLSR
jgi:hypothetical protein